MQWILSHTAMNMKPVAPAWACIHSKGDERFPTGGKGKGTDTAIKSHLNLLNQFRTSITECWPASPARQVVIAPLSSLERHFSSFRWFFSRHIEVFLPLFPLVTIHPGEAFAACKSIPRKAIHFVSDTQTHHIAIGCLWYGRSRGEECAALNQRRKHNYFTGRAQIVDFKPGFTPVYCRTPGKLQHISAPLLVTLGWQLPTSFS